MTKLISFLLVFLIYIGCTSKEVNRVQPRKNKCVLTRSNKIIYWNAANIDGCFSMTLAELWNKDFVCLLNNRGQLFINYNGKEIAGKMQPSSLSSKNMVFHGMGSDTIVVNVDTILNRYSNNSIDIQCSMSIKKESDKKFCKFNLFAWIKSDSIFMN
jgi:hypothetical protein